MKFHRFLRKFMYYLFMYYLSVKLVNHSFERQNIIKYLEMRETSFNNIHLSDQELLVIYNSIVWSIDII